MACHILLLTNYFEFTSSWRFEGDRLDNWRITSSNFEIEGLQRRGRTDRRVWTHFCWHAATWARCLLILIYRRRTQQVMEQGSSVITASTFIQVVEVPVKLQRSENWPFFWNPSTYSWRIFIGLLPSHSYKILTSVLLDVVFVIFSLLQRAARERRGYLRR